MTSASHVVVWCHLSSSSKVWVAFEPIVSNFIENVHATTQTNPLDISSCTSKFTYCEVDFKRRVLHDRLDGNESSIDRRIFSPDSVFSKMVLWEFEADGQQWAAFDIDSSQKIENAFSSRSKSRKKITLNPKAGLQYEIDLKNNTQKNIISQRKRKIQRSILSQPYLTNTHNLGQVPSASISPLKTDPKKTVTPSKGARSKLACSANSKYSCASAGGSSHTVSLPSEKRVKIKDRLPRKSKNSSVFLSQFAQPAQLKEGEEEETCVICLMELSSDEEVGTEEIVRLNQCQHVFHRHCLLQLIKHNKQEDFIQCPKCKCLYGDRIGDCPPGVMDWSLIEDISCPGYEGYATIVVKYDIPPGLQREGHPSPGKPFTAKGFPRKGYIPDTDKGRKVLILLMEAFRRRLMFTIGTSVTTGLTNTVTWTDIHHKTSVSCHNGHGYPDQNYLDNTLMELAGNGVIEELLLEKKEEEEGEGGMEASGWTRSTMTEEEIEY